MRRSFSDSSELSTDVLVLCRESFPARSFPDQSTSIVLVEKVRKMRTAEAFPVVTSLPPKNRVAIFGGREGTTGNASAVRRQERTQKAENSAKKQNVLAARYNLGAIVRTITIKLRKPLALLRLGGSRLLGS